ATTLWNRCFPEGCFVSFCSGFVANAVNRRDITLSAVMWFYEYFDTFWRDAFKMFFEQFRNFFPILMWYQTHRNFGESLASNNRFCTFTSVATPNTVDI